MRSAGHSLVEQRSKLCGDPSWRKTASSRNTGPSGISPRPQSRAARVDRRLQSAAVRHPEACGDPPALRSSPGARWRLQILGRDAGPVARSADKRLAVEVEDHPLDYGDFEGTIPKGQYGGGTVMLWDRGYWEPEGDQTPEEALAKGDLKFTLEGERLHGSWVLVRMKTRPHGRQAHQLAADQASRRIQPRGQRRRHSGPGQLDRLRPHDGGDRRRKGTRAETLHAAEQANASRMRSGTAAGAAPPTPASRQKRPLRP